MAILIGQPAPAWQARDQDGTLHSLDGYRGQWLLLYFYPKDETPGCTKEACAFRDAWADVQDKLRIFGVSADSQASHAEFALKHHLPFPLLADPDKTIINAYGANGLIMAKRVSFLIDPEGKIAKIYPQVKPEQHAAEVLADVQALQDKV
jgi:peroxiredoxin Q/BCP